MTGSKQFKKRGKPQPEKRPRIPRMRVNTRAYMVGPYPKHLSREELHARLGITDPELLSYSLDQESRFTSLRSSK